MRLFLSCTVLLMEAAAAAAHQYHAGQLLIQHPVIMVPSGQPDCSCAHVMITNQGSQPVYFLGATISAAARTHLLRFEPDGRGVSTTAGVSISPGQTLDLNGHDWCLFMSGITATLEEDVGVVPAHLYFRNEKPIAVEFMIRATKPP